MKTVLCSLFKHRMFQAFYKLNCTLLSIKSVAYCKSFIKSSLLTILFSIGSSSGKNHNILGSIFQAGVKHSGSIVE